MPFNPEDIIGEVLGRKAVKGIDPAALNHECPFIRSRCPKRTKQLANNLPYPVCSLWKKSSSPDRSAELIFVCPKRFFAVDFLREVVAHCWPGRKPTNPRVAPEVKMTGFGNVDFVIANVRKDGEIDQFLSVELQAIDITGSVFPAFKALCAGRDLKDRPTYGFNWDNVYKRYITQLIRKGYFHHHWKSKIVAVIPEQVYQYIIERADFMRSPDVTSSQVNIIFMSYRLDPNPARPGEYHPKLVRVEGTSHSSLQSAIMYKDAPKRKVFTEQIKRSLARAVNLSQLIDAEK